MSTPLHFISAGAGSGKTYRLTELLHEKLTAGVVRPEGILATTFTNRAAAELRERVRSHLIQNQRLDLATAIGQARIGTVNSVCGALLSRFAFEAGMPTEQRVLDESRAHQILNEAIDAVIEGGALTDFLILARRLSQDVPGFGEEKEPWKKALGDIVSQARANAIGPDELRAFAKRNADTLLSHFPPPSDRDLDKNLCDAIEAALPLVRNAANEGQKKNTGDYLRLLEQADRDLGDGEMPWGQWSSLVEKGPEAALRTIVQPVKDAASEHERHPRLHSDVRGYLENLFALASDVLDAYRERKRQLGAVDFTDQESELLAILDDPSVAETLRAELDLLMVDEFQDTSPIQLALFLKFAEYAREVVWVGDVKQAIYGFRGGDAALMAAVVAQLDELGGKKEVLPYSWRSRPALVGFTNSIFGKTFSGIPPAEVYLQPKRTEFTGISAVEDWLLEGKVEEQHGGIASGLAELIASGATVVDVESKQPRPIRLGDIAILARSNNNVVKIAQTLQSRSFRVSTEQPGLLGRPEVVLAIACLRRLNDERDTIASAEIISLADCEDPNLWLTDRLTWLDGGASASAWREQGEFAHPILVSIKSLREQRSILSPLEAVQLVIADCELTSRVLQWQTAPERARLRLANLERLIELAAEYEDECRSTRDAATLSGFLLWVQSLKEEGADALPQPAIDAVQVMTHHAAKGLEWPVVVLVDLASDVKESIWDSVRAESTRNLDVRVPLNERFLRYWPRIYGKQKNIPVVQAVETGESGLAIREAAVEEHKRLLYVSMTRARDLIVLARSEKKQNGEWMDAVGLGGYLPDADQEAIALSDGAVVPFKRRRLKSGSRELAVVARPENLHWFPATQRETLRIPLAFSPSSAAAVTAVVTESVGIGTRIVPNREIDAAMLGDAVHACLATQLACPDVPLSEDELKDIFRRMGVPDAIAPIEMLGQIRAVQSWMVSRWPGAEMLVEVPISQVLMNGQVLGGRIDLLLRTKGGWVLLDHKSGSQGSAQWDSLAASYGGQLASYSAAVEAVTGIPVRETWLVMPVAGTALRIEKGAN